MSSNSALLRHQAARTQLHLSRSEEPFDGAVDPYQLFVPALAGSGTLGSGKHSVQRLARGHEQAVALRPAEAHVAAYFGQPDAADELPLRCPYRYTAVTHAATGIA